MIWLTLRQHRTEISILVGFTLVVCIVLLITGIQVHHLYDTSGIAGCLRFADFPGQYPGTCGNAYDAFTIPTIKVYNMLFWLNILPLFYGLLLGVPLLAREYEQGTYKFIWMQSVTRTRWLFTKISTLLAVIFACTAILSAVMTWWNQPFDQLMGPFAPSSWDFEGIVPFAFAVLGFFIGVMAGTLLRRSIPAVALSFAYLPLWLLMDNWLRTKLPAPITRFYPLGSMPLLNRQDWQITNEIVDKSGHPIYGVPACPSLSPCEAYQGLQGHLIYQPISRFWMIQGVEAAIMLAIALILMFMTIWQVRIRAVRP